MAGSTTPRAPRVKPVTLAAAAAEGRLPGLRALRDVLTRQIDEGAPPRDLAALSLRLVDVLEQIEACEKASGERKGTPLDELRARREAKAAPSGASRSARGR